MGKGLSIYCDGGARGNPGLAAIGFVVYKDRKIIHKSSKKIGETTNNVAEYQAVIAALDWLINQSTIPGLAFGSPRAGSHLPSAISFYLDSQLIVNQLNGNFKIKNSNLQKLIVRAKNLERKINEEISYSYVSRRRNNIADALVNQALNGL